MKSNIVTRVIFDGENNKVYLSVEGKVEDATQEERINLKNTLAKAFSQVLGIEETVATDNSEILKDFQPTNNAEVPGFIEGANKPDNLEKVMEDEKKEEKTPINTIQDAENGKNTEKTQEVQKVQDPVIGFGKYSKLTAAEALKKDGQEAERYFKEFLVRVLKERIDRGEALAQEKLDSVNRALTQLDSQSSSSNEVSLFDKLNQEIVEVDPNLVAIGELCASYGTTYQQVIDTRNEEMLKKLYDEFMAVAKEIN